MLDTRPLDARKLEFALVLDTGASSVGGTMTFFKTKALLVGLSALVLTVKAPLAQVIYVADDGRQLLSYDVGTNMFTPIGTPMPAVIGGMGCADPTLLYGTDPLNPVGLYSIDPGTGTATRLGQVPGHSAVGSTVGPDGNVWAITNDAQGLLYTIDPAAVTAADIGFTGFSNEGQPAFDTIGNLFTFQVGAGSDTLYQLDPGTAQGTPIGPVGFSIYAAAFCGDILYAFSGGATRVIVTIDTATGTATVLGTYGAPVTGSIQSAACCPQ